MIIPNKYYIANGRNDGFGAQLQYYIWLILYIESFGGKFIMSKIKNMDHNYDKDPNFFKKVKECMNIEDYYIKRDINEECLLVNDIDAYKFVENNIDYCLNSTIMKKIKNLFWQNKNRKNIFNINDDNSKYYNIAVHVRRENIHDNREGGCCKVSNNYYKKKAIEACEKYLFNSKINKKKPIRIYIYSQGNIEDFKVYNDIQYGDVFLRINYDMFETFNQMVAADALILAPSSFSYIAAFLSDGEIYYYPFWHNPSKKWIISQNVPYIGLGGYDNII